MILFVPRARSLFTSSTEGPAMVRGFSTYNLPVPEFSQSCFVWLSRSVFSWFFFFVDEEVWLLHHSFSNHSHTHTHTHAHTQTHTNTHKHTHTHTHTYTHTHKRLLLTFWQRVQDIAPYVWEWVVVLLLVLLHTVLTFTLHVTDCPTGYLGPGGRYGEFGAFFNGDCTTGVCVCVCVCVCVYVCVCVCVCEIEREREESGSCIYIHRHARAHTQIHTHTHMHTRTHSHTRQPLLCWRINRFGRSRNSD